MKIVLLQTTIGDYRRKVLELLVDHWGNDFHVFAGRRYFYRSIKTNINLGENFSWVKNNYLFRRRALWQTGMWKSVVFADVAILEMNPRILSVWAIIACRKILRKKIVLWGHAWPRAGAGAKSDKVRHFMRSQADTIIAYTETQAAELRAIMPDTQIVAAPNALYSTKDMGAVLSDEGAKNFIYVGRLVESKKVQILLDALAVALPRMAGFGKLIVVGDGPIRTKLESQAAQLNIQERVDFLGHVSDVERLKETYSRSLVSFSPGYVGLSVTQSFAFGVPSIISKDENHSPELEAVIEGSNALFFETDSVESLADSMSQVWENRESWIGKRNEIAADCAHRYSAELMAARIIEATQ